MIHLKGYAQSSLLLLLDTDDSLGKLLYKLNISTSIYSIKGY